MYGSPLITLCSTNCILSLMACFFPLLTGLTHAIATRQGVYESVVKTVEDHWVVAKRGNGRQLFVTLTQSTANLVEITGGYNLISIFKLIFFFQFLNKNFFQFLNYFFSNFWINFFFPIFKLIFFFFFSIQLTLMI